LALLHEAEGYECEEDEFVAFEETARNPLVDCVADIEDEAWYTLFALFSCAVDGFEEEHYEGL
jgi:hypothetical protein